MNLSAQRYQEQGSLMFSAAAQSLNICKINNVQHSLWGCTGVKRHNQEVSHETWLRKNSQNLYDIKASNSHNTHQKQDDGLHINEYMLNNARQCRALNPHTSHTKFLSLHSVRIETIVADCYPDMIL